MTDVENALQQRKGFMKDVTDLIEDLRIISRKDIPLLAKFKREVADVIEGLYAIEQNEYEENLRLRQELSELKLKYSRLNHSYQTALKMKKSLLKIEITDKVH